jgi:hypothetical protein
VILVDTSVRVDRLHCSEAGMVRQLEAGNAAARTQVIGKT